MPTGRTIRELTSLAYFAKAEFPDVAHRERHDGFVEYAYAASNTQLNGRSSSGTIKIPDNYNEPIMPLPVSHVRKLPLREVSKRLQFANSATRGHSSRATRVCGRIRP